MRDLRRPAVANELQSKLSRAEGIYTNQVGGHGFDGSHFTIAIVVISTAITKLAAVLSEISGPEGPVQVSLRIGAELIALNTSSLSAKIG